MNRRTFVAASGCTLVGALSGCLAPATDGPQPDERASAGNGSDAGTGPDAAPDGSDGAPDATEPDDVAEASDEEAETAESATAHGVEFETAPVGASITDGDRLVKNDVRRTVAVTSPATEASPATVEIRLHNEADDGRRISADYLLPTGGTVQNARFHRIAHLAPTENHAVAPSVPDVELFDGRWYGTEAEGSAPETVDVPPGEDVVGEHHFVAGDRGDSPPLLAENYEFGTRDAAFRIELRRSDEPGPDGDSRFESADVPDLPLDRVAWFHEATPKTEVYLRPETAVVSPPADVAFHLVNDSLGALPGNPYEWRLYKFDDGEWFRIAPQVIPGPGGEIAAGTEDVSTLRLENDYAAQDQYQPATSDRTATVGPIGGGRYALQVGYGRYDEDGQTKHAALFEVEGPAATLEPRDDLDVTREDGRVTVESPRRERDERPATLAVSRVEDADDRLVTEQVSRFDLHGLRNALPFFEPGIETVELRTSSEAVSSSRFDDGWTFEYRGEAYEAVT